MPNTTPTTQTDLSNLTITELRELMRSTEDDTLRAAARKELVRCAVSPEAPETARRNAVAVETLREFTDDHAPEASDFGAVARVLNLNHDLPPTGKHWTAKQVKAAYDAYIAATTETK